MWKFAQPSIATGLQHWVVFQCIALAFANSSFFWLLKHQWGGVFARRPKTAVSVITTLHNMASIETKTTSVHEHGAHE
jgi:hypothetical protein